MHGPLSRRRSWQWPLGLLALVVLAQACGGSSKSTGPTGATRLTLHLTGFERAELPANCEGVLEVTGPGMSPVRAAIPRSGQLLVFIPPGSARVFTVTLTCAKTTGPRTYTGFQVTDVVPGQPLELTINLVVNDPPRASASCSPSSIAPGASADCRCTASDPDPGDRLSISWSATGGGVSPPTGPATSFSSGTPGTFDVTCTVSDGKATSSSTAQVTVTAAPGPPPPPPPPGTSPLTVALAGSGAGGVASAPPGITCPGTCTANFTNGTVVTLTAAPIGGSTFGGWSAPGCGVALTCVVTVTAATSVTATFNAPPPPPPPPPPPTFTLSVVKAGSASGTSTVTSAPAGITCGATCSASFPSGTSVTLTAVAGSFFMGWSGGGCSGTGTCTVVLSANTTVTATFELAGSIVIVNAGLSAGDILSGVTLTGPLGTTVGPLGPIAAFSSTTIPGVPPGSWTALAGVYYSAASACPALGFTVTPGGPATSVTYTNTGGSFPTCTRSSP